MASKGGGSLLGTKKRIRLGIWGLGRGCAFLKACGALNFDVVAGCDHSEALRQRFRELCPGAMATDDDDAFLAADFDAALLATYCPAHAADAIRCLEAGKHVLSEVTAFHTLAEGVRLVEAVERTGLVYNLAENYPYTKANMYLAAKWKQGLFGELQYAEYEYVHECRRLAYAYVNGAPIEPGWTVHNWRSWLNFHYYNTHSLGPVMAIAECRPTRVVALPSEVKLPGYLQAKSMHGMGGVAPSLIALSNGAVMRNLMGATTNDSHRQRLWGTKGSAEIGDGVFLRLGGAGKALKLEVRPEWPMLGEQAEQMGHGGGDFWVLYRFARHILFGEPAFFDIYRAADCTIPGILALRSAVENGQPFDVPDLRKPRDRQRCRHDDWAQKPYNVERGVFPKGADKTLASRFAAIVGDLLAFAEASRGALDWSAVWQETKEPWRVAEVLERFCSGHEKYRQTAAGARQLIRAFPRSDGARVLEELLELADAGLTTRKDFAARMNSLAGRIRREAPSGGGKPPAAAKA